MPVKGGDDVKRNYAKLVNKISSVETEVALWSIASEGLANSDTMTPMDTGFLLKSRFAPVIKDARGGKQARVGYVANYAAAVHAKTGKLKGQERANGSGQYWSPSGEPQFLTKGFAQLIKSGGIQKILKQVYRR